MTAQTLVESINGALHTAMDRDDSVVVLGEDVARTGGVFRCNAGGSDLELRAAGGHARPPVY